MKKNILYTMIFSLAFLGAVTVQAEDEIAVPTLYMEETVAPELIAEPILEEVVMDDVITEKIPSSFGLWWRGVKENVSLAFTFNVEKKFEKNLQFAEERMELAERIIENSDSEEVTEKAQEMMTRATAFMEKAEIKKGEIQELVAQRFEETKTRIEAHKETINQFVEEKKALLNRIQEGDESAQEQLELLHQERQEYNIQRQETIKVQGEIQNQRRDEAKIILKEKAENGDQGAAVQLERMEANDQQIQIRKEEREENKVKLQEQAQERREEMIVGGDVDAHGCIGSAGYLWCESKDECLRPFEEEWDETCGGPKMEANQERREERLETGEFSPTQPLNNMIQKEVQKAKALIN
ncbi:hypothetical protein KJ603_01590 [Patescibacteria group bacterium]|nr:hypothetical protein [Patescibacteria group bacterium]